MLKKIDIVMRRVSLRSSFVMLEPLRGVLGGYRIVLASGSPRRKEILANAGLLNLEASQGSNQNAFCSPIYYYCNTLNFS